MKGWPRLGEAGLLGTWRWQVPAGSPSGTLAGASLQPGQVAWSRDWGGGGDSQGREKESNKGCERTSMFLGLCVDICRG